VELTACSAEIYRKNHANATLYRVAAHFSVMLFRRFMFNQAKMQKLRLLMGNTDLVNQIHDLINGIPDGMIKKFKSASQPTIIRATK